MPHSLEARRDMINFFVNEMLAVDDIDGADELLRDHMTDVAIHEDANIKCLFAYVSCIKLIRIAQIISSSFAESDDAIDELQNLPSSAEVLCSPLLFARCVRVLYIYCNMSSRADIRSAISAGQCHDILQDCQMNLRYAASNSPDECTLPHLLFAAYMEGSRKGSEVCACIAFRELLYAVAPLLINS